MAFDIEKHALPISLVIGGITILWWLYSRSSQANASAQTVPVGTEPSASIPALQSSMPQYPNAQQPTPGAINIGGSPLYLNYNVSDPPMSPSSPIDDNYQTGSGCDCDCGSGMLSAQVQIPVSSINSQVENLQSVFVPGSKVAPIAAPVKSPVLNSFTEAA